MWGKYSFRVLLIILMAALLGTFCLVAGASASGKEETICKMQFSLKGWSAVYQTAKGAGTITCENGQSAEVTLDVKGGGITGGITDIEDGVGRFSSVSDISELFGPYVKAEAHAGVTESATAQILTKGTVTLALSGVGKGVNLGIAFGRLTIAPKE